MAIKIKKRRTGDVRREARIKLDARQTAHEGARLLDEGNLEAAEKALRQALDLDSGCALAWSLLTDLFEKDNRTEEAIAALKRLVETVEPKAGMLLTLANRSFQFKQYAQARILATRAMSMDPDVRIEAGLLAAYAAHGVGQWEWAVKTANEVLQVDPDNLRALELRYVCWYCLAWVSEEAADHRHYIRVKPDVERHSRLLFMINYLAETTPEQVYRESVEWSDLYAEPLAVEVVPHRNTPDPARRLRVAYISPDLRAHAIMKLLPAVFEKHDEEHFEIFAYSVNTKEDEQTQSVRRSIKNFVDLPLDRKVIAERVRADEIDILIDLAGHSMHTDAYLAFAAKPAPVQASWLGILSTTGLKTMDYFIGDEHMPCPGTEHLFTEKVYRLPRAVCCYRPSNDFEVGVPPYFTNGYITFGCFNDPRKITEDAVKVWAILLYSHPTAKLLLKYQALELEITQRRIRGWFANYGVAMNRIIFEGKHKAAEYMLRYRAVDIALDPFPYNGGTTTLDALWMGVPIVSMSGRLPVSCSGASSLSALGLPVAKSVEEYIALASQLVEAIPSSPNIRQQIRDAMVDSPLMDEDGLVRALEAAYRDMWRTWCATPPHPVLTN